MYVAKYYLDRGGRQQESEEVGIVGDTSGINTV